MARSLLGRAGIGARIAPSPFARDVVVSGMTGGMVMVSLVLVTGWLAAGLGPTAFGVYALSRRVLSAVVAVFPGPLGVALARSLAGTRESRERGAYLWAGTLLALVPALGLVAAGVAAPEFWAGVLLSDRRYAPEWLATLALIVATTVYSLVFARLRGTSRIGAANRWQLWALAIGPLIVAGTLARRGSVSLVLFLLAAVTFTATVPLLAWLTGAARTGLGQAELRRPLRDLLRYSLPRLPGAAALGALLALGPLLAPYFGDLRDAGYLVAGQSILRVAEVGTAGFGLVVLPKVSALQAERQESFLRDRVEDLLALVLHVGLFAACQLVIWAPEIVRVWLGADYLEAVPVVRVLMIALGPYLGYTLLRSVIDGMEERPVNTLNLYAAVACTALLSLALGAGGLGVFGLALASAAGLGVLGALTYRYLRRRLRFDGGHLHLGAAVALNLTAASLVLGLRSLLLGRLGPSALVLVGAGLSGVLLLGYLLVLRHLRVRWLVEVEARLLRRGGDR